MVKFYICVIKIVIKWQTIIVFIIIIMELISQNHGSLCLYIFNKHFTNNRIIKWKIHNNNIKNLINNINLMIHYNHIEILPQEVYMMYNQMFSWWNGSRVFKFELKTSYNQTLPLYLIKECLLKWPSNSEFPCDTLQFCVIKCDNLYPITKRNTCHCGTTFFFPTPHPHL